MILFDEKRKSSIILNMLGHSLIRGQRTSIERFRVQVPGTLSGASHEKDRFFLINELA